jgi:hypothetical protein
MPAHGLTAGRLCRTKAQFLVFIFSFRLIYFRSRRLPGPMPRALDDKNPNDPL